jgi:hypothetical protein
MMLLLLLLMMMMMMMVMMMNMNMMMMRRMTTTTTMMIMIIRMTMMTTTKTPTTTYLPSTTVQESPFERPLQELRQFRRIFVHLFVRAEDASRIVSTLFQITTHQLHKFHKYPICFGLFPENNVLYIIKESIL